MKIAYVVHDMHDPAVPRRTRMLQEGGATVVVIGFRRGESAPEEIAGAPAVDLGRTADAKLAQRALSVLCNLIRPGRMLRAAAGADVIIGRNLEALALARRIRRSNRSARLIYECLDIHRTLLGHGPGARAVQAAEGRLLQAIDLLIVSSPAFVRDYFAHRPSLTAPTLLVENKPLVLEGPPPAPPAPPPGPPWVIGWFGNLRCRRTFTILKGLAARQEGRVEIRIAGRPSPAVFADLAAEAAAAPHVTFLGAYAAADLPRLYASCHFAWAIDYFEEGLNSRWLLPNRLYEAPSFGTVPIALASVETGRWLAAHDAGLLIDGPADLDALLSGLDQPGYARLRAQVEAIPRSTVIAGPSDCTRLVQALAG